MDESAINLWGPGPHAEQYLSRADTIPGENALLEFLPKSLVRALDVGTGDGRLLSIVMRGRVPQEAVALD
jgi:tRNA (cmo5U34)-methyltransferase